MTFLDFLIRNFELLVTIAGLTVLAGYVVIQFSRFSYYRPDFSDRRIAYSYDFMAVMVEARLTWYRRIILFLKAHRNPMLLIAGILVAMELAFAIPRVRAKVHETALNFPMPLCSAAGNDSLLLFIHGWDGDPLMTWQQFPQLACSDPQFRNVDVLVVNYPTFMLRRSLHVAELSDWVNRHLDFGKSGKYKHVAIVAHSMGGLIGRELVILRTLSGNQKAIVAIVEIGSPHQGANPADLASILGISKPLTEEMTPGSSYLATLQTEWQAVNPRPTSECFTSPQDYVVSEGSATYQCDNFIRYPQWDHRQMVKPESRTDDRYAFPIATVAKYLLP